MSRSRRNYHWKGLTLLSQRCLDLTAGGGLVLVISDYYKRTKLPSPQLGLVFSYHGVIAAMLQVSQRPSDMIMAQSFAVQT